MGDIAIGEDDPINAILGEEARKFLFRIDGNPFWVISSSKFRRIGSVGDERDLRGSKSNHSIIGSVPEESIEIVEVSSPSPENDHPDGFLP